MASTWRGEVIPGRLPAAKQFQPFKKLWPANKNKARFRHFLEPVYSNRSYNSDGTNREDLIEHCQLGERLELRFDEEPNKNKNRIKVCHPNGNLIGFLNSGRVSDIILKMESGYHYTVYVAEILKAKTGIRGLVLLIVEGKPTVTVKELKDYLVSLDLKANRSMSPDTFRDLAILAIFVIALVILLINYPGL